MLAHASSRIWRLITLTFTAVALAACATQSTTQGGAVGANRKQLLLVSSEEMNEAQSKGQLNPNAQQTQRVRTIAQRLIPHTNVFRPDALSWKWEVNVIESPQVNAFCAPGGKIAVYTGLINKLNITDDELAAVMGHEIAHALREHSREAASRQMAQQAGLSIAGAVLGVGQGAADLASMVGKVTLELPNSRQNEAEADRIGLELAARAGYNPAAAITLWNKMSAQGGGGTPQWLSTHPSDSSRISDIQKTLPAVQPLYEAARKR